MAIRVISSKMVGIDPDGTVITFLEGYCNSDDTGNLPTKGVCEGSNFIVTNNGDWLFFNEESESYVTELNIQD